MAGTGKGRYGLCDSCRDVEVSRQHRPGLAIGLSHARALPGRLGGAFRLSRAVLVGLSSLGRNRKGRYARSRPPPHRHGFCDFRRVPHSRHVRRKARRSGCLHPGSYTRFRLRSQYQRSGLAEERFTRGDCESQSRRKACAGQLHRLCLHELPLDEVEYVHAAGDCRTS